MSEFFENIGYAAKRAVSSVGVEVSVAALEQRIKEAQRIIGQQYYQCIANGQLPQGPEFDAQVEIIRDLRQQIQEKRRSHDANC